MSQRDVFARCALITGLVAVSVVACFPPRDTEHGTRASRGFLLSKDINFEVTTTVVKVDREGWVTPGHRPGETRTQRFRTARLNVATGRMLGECLLILSMTGVFAFVASTWPSLSRRLGEVASALAEEAKTPPRSNAETEGGGKKQLPPITGPYPKPLGE